MDSTLKGSVAKMDFDLFGVVTVLRMKDVLYRNSKNDLKHPSTNFAF